MLISFFYQFIIFIIYFIKEIIEIFRLIFNSLMNLNSMENTNLKKEILVILIIFFYFEISEELEFKSPLFWFFLT